MLGAEYATVAFRNVTSLVGTLIWPVVVVLAIMVAASPQGLRLLAPVLRRVSKVSGPGGFALTLSPEAAAATKSDVETGLGTYASALKRELDRLAGIQDVGRLLAGWGRGATQNLAPNADCRATVHIPDPLYSDTLYQLVDYWPRGKGTGGRRFSVRFGILGLAWRLEESQKQGEVDPIEGTLVREWGMTRDQARHAGFDRQSFLCLVLRHEGLPVGVLYLDAVPQNVFAAINVGAVEQLESVRQLASAVSAVSKAIAASGPGLQLYDNA